MSTGFPQPLFIFLLIASAVVCSYNNSPGQINSQYNQIDTTAYVVIQVPPAFPGGNNAMFEFIQSASQYPVNLKKGLLIQLKLLIEKDGSISSVQVDHSSVADELIQEAVRIAKMMPKWTPGSQNGQVLRVYALVPIRFISAKKL